MAGVAEADDLAIVEEVVLAQRGDAAGGPPETGMFTASIGILIQDATTHVREPPWVTMIWCSQSLRRISPIAA